jgi:Flp pilus assembly protein TadG
VADPRSLGHGAAREEEGQAIAELVIVTPVLLLVIVLMISLGRIVSAQGDVESAARAGVQAAVVQDNPSDAQAQAVAAVASTLGTAGLTCPSPHVTTNTSDFTPGGSVSVTVTCVTSLADVSIPGVPGTKTLSATSFAPIDPYRTVS